MIRSHQKAMELAVDDIIAGAPVNRIILHVLPGAGKSCIPIIAGRLITAGLADALCWVCPRKALQDQGERNFLDPFFREMFGHSLSIRSSTNDVNPCRGTSGFVTTYQAISMDTGSVSREFSKKRYILIMDEFHHVEYGGEWFKSLEPLVARAQFLVLMTGTIERGNGGRIAYLDYLDDKPQLSGPGFKYITYGREEALKEKAVLPLTFILSDGYVEWQDTKGRRQAGSLSGRIRDSSSALFTALDTGFADELMTDGVNHWEEHGRKLLVVTANIDHATRFWLGLKSEGLYAKIATSHESRLAMTNIKEFKYGDLNILITIAMAYEGLDVPEITHIICLTHIRSVPWIEQMIARAVRIDRTAGPYESQRGYIFAPDDFLFRAVVDRIKAEQLPIISNAEGEKAGAGTGTGERGPGIIPLGSKLTNQREVSFGEAEGYPCSFHPIKTVKERETGLLEEINTHVGHFSFINRYRPERINAEIKAHFGCSRREMSEKDLRACLEFVQWNYPIRANGFRPLAGVSQSRGRGVRVSPRAVSWDGE